MNRKLKFFSLEKTSTISAPRFSKPPVFSTRKKTNILRISPVQKLVKKESKILLNQELINTLSQKQVEVIELLKAKVPINDFFEFPQILDDNVHKQMMLLEASEASNNKVEEIIDTEIESNKVIKLQLKQMDEIALKRYNEIDEVQQCIEKLDQNLKEFIHGNDLEKMEVLNLTNFTHKLAEMMIENKNRDQQGEIKYIN